MVSSEESTSDLTAQVDVVEDLLPCARDAEPALVVLTGYDAGRIHVLNNYETMVGRADECDIQIFEPTVSRRHARFVSSSEGVELFDLRSSNGISINGQVIQRQWLKDQDVICLGGAVSFKFIVVTRSEHRYQEQLFENTAHDSLTQFYNKRYFKGLLEQRLLSARKRLENLTLFMLDLDHFKQVNDTHGHQVGDAALQHVSSLIRGESRNNDLLGRYGGEEFIMLVTEVDFEGSLRVAERIRKTIEDMPLVLDNLYIHLTISVGMASAREADGNPERLIALADGRLYTAKRNGRNQVCSVDVGGARSGTHP